MKDIFRYEVLSLSQFHAFLPHLKLEGGSALTALREASIRIENKTTRLSGFCYSKPKSFGEFS